MKGCIEDNQKLSIRDLFKGVGKEIVENYNWLITNREAYPCNVEIEEAFGLDNSDSEYCWVDGKKIWEKLNIEDFQWIWGVFSAFPLKIKLDNVLEYQLPFADGYTGFWKNPISIQHPLADIEIVAWDGYITLAIANKNEIIENIMECEEYEDLEEYNKK